MFNCFGGDKLGKFWIICMSLVIMGQTQAGELGKIWDGQVGSCETTEDLWENRFGLYRISSNTSSLSADGEMLKLELDVVYSHCLKNAQGDIEKVEVDPFASQGYLSSLEFGRLSFTKENSLVAWYTGRFQRIDSFRSF